MKLGLRRHGNTHDPRKGSDPIPGLGAGGFRAVYGAIYNDANVIEPGSADWTAEWAKEDGSEPSSNFFTIRFDVAFDDLPVVALTATNNNPPNIEGRYVASLTGRDEAWIEIITEDIDDADALDHNGSIDFIVIGAAA